MFLYNSEEIILPLGSKFKVDCKILKYMPIFGVCRDIYGR